MKVDNWKFEQLKQNLPDYAERYLTKSKRKKYCCPKCGSGTGSNNNYTGALGIHLAKDERTPLFTCRSCGATGNIYQLVMLNEGLDFEGALRRVRELYDPSYSIFDDDERTVKTVTYTKTPAVKPKTQATGKPATENKDFRNYYKMWKRNIKDTNYPQKRGLDDAIINRFYLGFEPEWVNEEGEKNVNEERAKEGKNPIKLTPSPRMIIPVDATHYTARDTRADADIPDWAKAYKKVQVGKDGPLFNAKAMNDPLCFFVCEGEIDAMSIEQAGGACVAYRSTGNKDHFCQELKKRDVTQTGTVIIVQDNDPAGKEASDYIEKFCKDNGFLFTRKNISGQYKDPNDHLVYDRNSFYATVKGVIAELRKERMAEYMEKYSIGPAVASFMRKERTADFTTPTGFPIMDNFLDGGLHPGLYILGAISSIGKTTFCLQLAEQIATDRFPQGTQEVIPGRDVLFFSLEQSKDDLISKSLSRRTYDKSMQAGQMDKLAKFNMTILRRETWQKWTQAEWDTFWACQEELQRLTQNHLFIVEAVGDYGIEEVTRDVKNHVAVTGRKPIVIIDYLQIMRPYDERMADKQNIDRTTSALKRLSRDYDIPIIAISSFNRESYWQQVTMTSFKESGSVEYSSDCLLALSPAGVVDAKNDEEKRKNRETIEKTKNADVRKIELHVLKNRNGRITNKEHRLYFDYTAKFNHFKETKESYLSNFDNGNPDNKTVYM